MGPDESNVGHFDINEVQPRKGRVMGTKPENKKKDEKKEAGKEKPEQKKPQAVKEHEEQIKKEQKFAKSKGWHRIGATNVDCKILLTDKDKIELGAAQSNALLEAQRLGDEKKRFDTDINGRIQEQMTLANDQARLLHAGYRIENHKLPCFIDLKAKERVYMDLQTGKEMHRSEMRPEDKQLRIA